MYAKKWLPGYQGWSWLSFMKDLYQLNSWNISFSRKILAEDPKIDRCFPGKTSHCSTMHTNLENTFALNSLLSLKTQSSNWYANTFFQENAMQIIFRDLYAQSNLFNGHFRDWPILAVLERCPFFTGRASEEENFNAHVSFWCTQKTL